MKIISFQLTIQQGVDNNGCANDYYLSIDENGVSDLSQPYSNIPYKEHAAILGIIQSGIVKYGILVNECNRANQALKLEEYAPKPSAEETSSNSALPQTCELGDGEVSTEIKDAPFEEEATGADGDIDKTRPTIVITKTTEEDDW